jgi:hypothetical protein
MWPFTARRSPLHAAEPGKPTLSRAARRRRERIDLNKRETLARLETQRRELEVTRELDVYAEEKAERAESRKAGATRQAREALSRRLRAFRTRLDNDRPLLAALIVSGLSLIATIAGQLMVYTSLNWHGYAALAYILPFIVEGATWSFAIYSQWLATRPWPLPYAKYTRLMWLFAAYAATANTYHVSHTLRDVVTGALLGGASLVGPFVWHSYITLTRTARSGRSAAQIRAALLQRLFNPLLSLRTAKLWAAAGGAMTRDQAWLLVYRNVHGHFPGQHSTTRQVTARNQWLWVMVRPFVGRVINPTAGAAPLSADSAPSAPLSSTAERTGVSAPRTADRVLVPALPSGAEDINPSALGDDVEDWLRGLENLPGGTAEERSPAPLSGDRSGRSNPVSEAAEVPGQRTADQAAEAAPASGEQRAQASGRKSAGKRARQRAAEQARRDFRPAIETYFRDRISAGADPAAITGTEVARKTGAADSTARNILADLKRSYRQSQDGA